MLELQQVEITLGATALFPPLNITVCDAEIVTVMGPSGCGKSTLLALISGALSDEFSYSGSVKLNGVDVLSEPMEKRQIGILFQDDLLFPHMNVAENLMFALPQEVKGEKRIEAMKKALADAELSGFEKRDITTLSGGQRARVSLLRTLLARPKAVLLDEPFSKLDETLRGNFRIFVREQVRQMNIPALLVTHDDADILGKQLVHLKGEMG